MPTEHPHFSPDAAAKSCLELLDEYAESPLIRAALRSDVTSDCLFHEVSGLLEGIAEGVILKGQPRLSLAATALIESSKSWELPRGKEPDLETPLDKFYDALMDILFVCGSCGLGVAEVSFDPRQRPRAGSSQRGK